MKNEKDKISERLRKKNIKKNRRNGGFFLI